jgi:RNA polymerase sigma factor (sigma-70 family)
METSAKTLLNAAPRTIRTGAARLSLATSVTTLVCLAGLHVLSPEFDPSWRVVSEYALGRHGWALSLMFLAWAVSSWSLAFAIRSQVQTIGGRIGLVFLVIAGIGEALAAVFDLRQPVGHGLAGALAVPTLPIAATLIGASLGRTRAWFPARTALLGTAGLTWLSLALLVVAMVSLKGSVAGVQVPIGWLNRLLVVVYCTWVIVVAWLAIRLRDQATATTVVPPVRMRREPPFGFACLERGFPMDRTGTMAPPAGQPPAVPIDDLLRELIPKVLGTVLRRVRAFPGAEDAVQEAALAAAVQWPGEGLPDNPRAWLTRVALRSMTDQIRSEAARRRRESEVALETAHRAESMPEEPAPEEDDTLALLFMCCHPALSTASAIALTLRAVGGLTTAEIANAFFVPEATMAQRISRAKQSVQNSGIGFQLPTTKERAQRLRAVLRILYLIFNEGYTTSAGPELRRGDLSREAIRLARLLPTLQPDDTETAGLLVLMLLTDARRLARTGPGGELIPLAQQDRALWDRQQIAEGVALLSAALPRGSVGPYQLQAAIAAVHDEAARAEDTDWPQILALYDLLRRMSDNPMVRLNHAVAAAMVHGAAHGLELLDALRGDARLAGHHRLDAVRAHLLELVGDRTEAARYYRAAASKTGNLPERDYLLMQAARLANEGE